MQAIERGLAECEREDASLASPLVARWTARFALAKGHLDAATAGHAGSADAAGALAERLQAAGHLALSSVCLLHSAHCRLVAGDGAGCAADCDKCASLISQLGADENAQADAAGVESALM